MRDGEPFGADDIAYFNGGLFVEVKPVPLTGMELKTLAQAASLDWGSIEPAIFGTLFERSLDPRKRSQLGPHYTGRPDIERVVDPVVMMPLRRRWDAVRAELDQLIEARGTAPTTRIRQNRLADFRKRLQGFQEELASVSVLDPACGSGNFLYVTLSRLLDLEKEVLIYGANHGLSLGYPTVGPRQLAGLEIDPYAYELAQVVIWIGYLQWMIENGFSGLLQPVLPPPENDSLAGRALGPLRPGESEASRMARRGIYHWEPTVLGVLQIESRTN